jgi:hypothetical protein
VDLYQTLNDAVHARDLEAEANQPGSDELTLTGYRSSTILNKKKMVGLPVPEPLRSHSCLP